MPKRASRKRPAPSPAKTGKADADGRLERLQKVLAAAGLGSRRNCEELIVAGRVEIDRKTVTELGTKVDTSVSEVRVDGTVLRWSRRVYYALYKPVGVVCTNRDPAGRPRAVDLIPTKNQRLFTVGRLDISSDGLILLTNDGDLADRLTHPRYRVRKRYRVLVAGQMTPETAAEVRKGIHLAEGLAKVVGLRIRRSHKKSTILEMDLEEGRNREIRRVLAKVGHKVLGLTRIAVGPIKLGTMAPGEYRRLSRKDIDALQRAVRTKQTT